MCSPPILNHCWPLSTTEYRRSGNEWLKRLSYGRHLHPPPWSPWLLILGEAIHHGVRAQAALRSGLWEEDLESPPNSQHQCTAMWLRHLGKALAAGKPLGDFSFNQQWMDQPTPSQDHPDKLLLNSWLIETVRNNKGILLPSATIFYNLFYSNRKQYRLQVTDPNLNWLLTYITMGKAWGCLASGKKEQGTQKEPELFSFISHLCFSLHLFHSVR